MEAANEQAAAMTPVEDPIAFLTTPVGIEPGQPGAHMRRVVDADELMSRLPAGPAERGQALADLLAALPPVRQWWNVRGGLGVPSAQSSSAIVAVAARDQATATAFVERMGNERLAKALTSISSLFPYKAVVTAAGQANVDPAAVRVLTEATWGKDQSDLAFVLGEQRKKLDRARESDRAKFERGLDAALEVVSGANLRDGDHKVVHAMIERRKADVARRDPEVAERFEQLSRLSNSLGRGAYRNPAMMDELGRRAEELRAFDRDLADRLHILGLAPCFSSDDPQVVANASQGLQQLISRMAREMSGREGRVPSAELNRATEEGLRRAATRAVRQRGNTLLVDEKKLDELQKRAASVGVGFMRDVRREEVLRFHLPRAQAALDASSVDQSLLSALPEGVARVEVDTGYTVMRFSSRKELHDVLHQHFAVRGETSTDHHSELTRRVRSRAAAFARTLADRVWENEAAGALNFGKDKCLSLPVEMLRVEFKRNEDGSLLMRMTDAGADITRAVAVSTDRTDALTHTRAPVFRLTMIPDEATVKQWVREPLESYAPYPEDVSLRHREREIEVDVPRVVDWMQRVTGTPDSEVRVSGRPADPRSKSPARVATDWRLDAVDPGRSKFEVQTFEVEVPLTAGATQVAERIAEVRRVGEALKARTPADRKVARDAVTFVAGSAGDDVARNVDAFVERARHPRSRSLRQTTHAPERPAASLMRPEGADRQGLGRTLR